MGQDEDNQTQTRVFDPFALYGHRVDLDSIEVCSDDGRWTHVACDHEEACPTHHTRVAHLDSMVIAVDGVCRGNGTAAAVGAAGVFFGEGSPHNRSVVLSGADMTNQVAELRAGILALYDTVMLVRKRKLGIAKLDTVVVKADSEYLVKGVTEWVFKWEGNGYINSKGRRVKNRELFQQLHGLVGELGRLQVKVLFWHVPRGRNREADQLANDAFQKR